MSTEILFRGYYPNRESKIAFTGYTLKSIVASFSPTDLLEIDVKLWTGLKDWRGTNIYEGDIVSYWWQRDNKGFSGRVEYEPQLGKWIVFDGKRYIDLTKSGMKGSEEGTFLTDAEVIGNMYCSPALLTTPPATDGDSSNAGRETDLWRQLLAELPSICLTAPIHEPEREEHIINKLQERFRLNGNTPVDWERELEKEAEFDVDKAPPDMWNEVAYAYKSGRETGFKAGASWAKEYLTKK